MSSKASAALKLSRLSLTPEVLLCAKEFRATKCSQSSVMRRPESEGRHKLLSRSAIKICTSGLSSFVMALTPVLLLQLQALVKDATTSEGYNL